MVLAHKGMSRSLKCSHDDLRSKFMTSSKQRKQATAGRDRKQRWRFFDKHKLGSFKVSHDDF